MLELPPPQALEVYAVPEDQLVSSVLRPPVTLPRSPVNTVNSLSPEALAALPRDPVPLESTTPSPQAVTDFRGQIVELAPSDQPQPAPEKADYLSASNLRVEEEQASRRFQINPEVVAPTFSEKSAINTGQAGDAQALQKGEVGKTRGEAPLPSPPQVASLPPSPSRAPAGESGGPEPLPTPSELARAPEKTTVEQKRLDASTESDLLAKPVSEKMPSPSPTVPIPTRTLTTPLLAKLSAPLQPPLTPTPVPRVTPENTPSNPPSNTPVAQVASVPTATRSGSRAGTGEGGGDGGSAELTFRQGERRGAPSNDRLQEKKGDATLLNAREFKYYGYMQLIRRQVNFYWSQALDNISGVEEPLRRSEYTTVVNLTLDAKGNLKELSMVRTCGVKRFDEATLLAFRAAAPFPPPPEGLVGSNGEANMPEFSFTVTLGQPAPRYSGIDPRAHVLFPGIARP